MKFTASSNPVSTLLASSSEAEQSAYAALPVYVRGRKVDIPENFDGRKVWGKLLTPVQNQGACGACWAIASTSALADLFNIQSGGALNVTLSAAKLILCDVTNQPSYDPRQGNAVEEIWGGLVKQILTDACYGSSLSAAYTYLYIFGTVTEKCLPFSKETGFRTYDLAKATDMLNAPVCMDLTGEIGDVCVNSIYDPKTGLQTGDPQEFYRSRSNFAVVGEKSMIHKIYVYGPVATGFMVHEDFYSYDAKNLIYQWDRESKEVGGHAVVVVGFGVDKGVKFWLVRNSWGTEWGDDGYFRIIRGVNECQIEENAVGCIPDFWYPFDLQTIAWLDKHLKITTTEQQIYLTKLYQHRAEATTLWGTTGGGINPLDGTIWRTMSAMPWHDYQPPVDYTNIPDWSTTWMCGRDFENGVLMKHVSGSTKAADAARSDTFRSDSGDSRGAAKPDHKEHYRSNDAESPYAGLYAAVTSCICLVMLVLIVVILWRRAAKKR